MHKEIKFTITTSSMIMHMTMVKTFGTMEGQEVTIGHIILEMIKIIMELEKHLILFQEMEILIGTL